MISSQKKSAIAQKERVYNGLASTQPDKSECAIIRNLKPS